MARVGAPTFQSVVTASRWSTALDALVHAAVQKHGTVTDNGQTVPIVTNREAVQLVRAWHLASPSDFALWYQYAALAYGWDPPDSDMLDASPERSQQGYRLLVALWAELARVAMVLDNQDPPQEPRLDLAINYADTVWLGEVRAALLADGASATFKIPTGLCRDKRTKKPRARRNPFPGAKCEPNKDGEGRYRDPFTGGDLPCDLPGDCDDIIVDPITDTLRRLGPVLSWALILGALWLVAKDSEPQPRRRRRN